jgi:hypothetical protein
MPAAQGRFRRAVDRAWTAAGGAGGPAEKDAWYRGQLNTIAGIASTRGLAPEAIVRLAGDFERMAGADAAPVVPGLPGLSEAQQGAFRRLAIRAWRVMQQRGQAPAAGFNAWINARIGEATSMSAGRRSGQVKFDQLVCSLAIVAGDEYWLDRTAQSAERRIRYRIRQELAKLSAIQGRELDWSYAQGICEQARLAPSLDDCPAQHLRAILAMLVYAGKRGSRTESLPIPLRGREGQEEKADGIVTDSAPGRDGQEREADGIVTDSAPGRDGQERKPDGIVTDSAPKARQ